MPALPPEPPVCSLSFEVAATTAAARSASMRMLHCSSWRGSRCRFQIRLPATTTFQTTPAVPPLAALKSDPRSGTPPSLTSYAPSPPDPPRPAAPNAGSPRRRRRNEIVVRAARLTSTGHNRHRRVKEHRVSPESQQTGSRDHRREPPTVHRNLNENTTTPCPASAVESVPQPEPVDPGTAICIVSELIVTRSPGRFAATDPSDGKFTDSAAPPLQQHYHTSAGYLPQRDSLFISVLQGFRAAYRQRPCTPKPIQPNRDFVLRSAADNRLRLPPFHRDLSRARLQNPTIQCKPFRCWPISGSPSDGRDMAHGDIEGSVSLLPVDYTRRIREEHQGTHLDQLSFARAWLLAPSSSVFLTRLLSRSRACACMGAMALPHCCHPSSASSKPL